MLPRHPPHRFVEPLETVELGDPRVVQGAAHDLRQIGTVRPAVRQPGTPAHRHELVPGVQGPDVRAVVDQPDPPIDDPQVVGVEVAAGDAIPPAFGKELDHARPVAAGVGLAGLERIDQHRAMPPLMEMEDGIEAARVLPCACQRAQVRGGRDDVRRLPPVVEDLEHVFPVAERHAFHAASQHREGTGGRSHPYGDGLGVGDPFVFDAARQDR